MHIFLIYYLVIIWFQFIFLVILQLYPLIVVALIYVGLQLGNKKMHDFGRLEQDLINHHILLFK
jgi:hypothetical protein